MSAVRRALLGAAVGAWWLAACAHSSVDPEPLQEAVREYNEALRWGKHEEVISRLSAAERRAFLDRAERVEDDLEIHDCAVTRVSLLPDGRSADVRVEVSWYLRADPISRKTVVEERWSLRGTAWVVLGHRRLRGPRLDLLEAAARPAGAPAAATPAAPAAPAADAP